MKYDPRDSPDSEIGWLMMPFADGPEETDWELVDLISDTLATMSEKDRTALFGVFYEMKTYQQVADDLGTKAKSHAWRTTQAAMRRLKSALMENPQFRQKVMERYRLKEEEL